MSRNLMIERLIKHFGTQEKLAEAIKVRQGTVTGWLNNKHGISYFNARKIEKITNGEIKAIDLCPKFAELEDL